MDCSNFVKKCQTHLNKNINFLQIYPESADYKLACQKCLSIIQSKSYIFDLQEVLNEENDILHYWPLSQQEKCFEEALQILQILDTDEYQQQISQKIKILRTKFDDQIFKLENKLQECNSDKIKQQFYLKYKQAAQMKQLVEYIKEELTQQNQEESTKQKFKQFIKQQIENNEIENLLQHLKENQQKQEINLNILSQITVSIEQIFQDPKLNKYAQDQAIKQNYEQNELQIKIESLMTQLEELKQKNEQELILKSEDIQNLTEKINLRTSQCDTSLKSSNIFSQNCETLSQNFKQKEEDLNNQAQKQDINTFHEKYFINLKSKQSISHIHELKLTRFQGGRNIYSQHTCQICKKKKLKFSWYCYQCSYDVCQSCIYKEEQNILQRANLQQQYKKDGKLLLSFFTKQIKMLPLHEHQLNLISPFQSKISCNICLKKDILFSWRCNSCDFDVCLSCSNLQQIFTNHEHTLKLTKSHRQRYHSKQGTTQCDNCNKKRLQFSWHCFQCKYDLCLNCTNPID